jgi:hydroxycarboxylate dehydrogenase B
MAEELSGEVVTLAPGRLEAFTRDIFVAAGTPPAVAERLARSLVEANLSGHDSHGLIRISSYLAAIKDDQVHPAAEPKVVRDGPSWALVDGQWAFGQETARFSIGLAIEKARGQGVGLASALRCNHIGRVGEWTEQAAAAGMIGLASVAFGPPKAINVAPYGGAARALSTNPISIASPRGDGPPLLLDFATSVSAEGKVRVARDKGAPLPPGVIVDRDGNPSTDPNDLYAGGALQPVGGHKGYALSVMVEILSVALSGADEPANHAPNGANSGSFFLAIDPSVFREFEAFTDSVESIARRLTAVPPAPGFDEVLLPGDPEYRTRRARSAALSLPLATWKAISADGAALGVEVPAVD